MALRKLSQLRELASAVARAFAAADLTPEERNPPRIEHTQLPWSVPALMPTADLAGESLSVYLDHPVPVEAKDLHRFWVQTLQDTWNKPQTCMAGGTYAGVGKLLQNCRVGIRAFRFAQPPGYPAQLREDTGVQLSLEVAHTAFLSLPVASRKITLNDYIVTLNDGTEFGVRDGRPIPDSPWEFNASGSILEMLENGRGPITHDCQYDQIAALRSVIHTHMDKFEQDFGGLDTALQALRYLSWGGHCPNLVTAMQVVPVDMRVWAMRERVVRDALDVMASNRMNDRQKLQTLHSLLVPDVMRISQFKREIYNTLHFPFSLTRDKAGSIETALRHYYETEIPCSLRRNL